MKGAGSIYSRIDRLLPKNKLLRRISVTAISLTVFVLVWWVASRMAETSFLPPPDAVVNAFFESFSVPDPNLGITMWQNIWVSLQRFLWGFALAFAVAV